MGKKIQCIGRYVMDGITLGKGNFAKVELATHGVTQIKVAIKVIETHRIKEDYVRANLHREAKIMSRLRHPNIIRLYETLKATMLYCLVLEYAEGGELLTYIKSQEGCRLTEPCARPFIRQLVSALHYIHDRGVVHRDLKMENIMLDASKKNIKLIDFGLSNVYKEDEPLKTHCGSPEYAAPELFVVGKTYGPEIDIWSLGIIMYAMTIGKLPFSTPFKDEYQRQRMLQQIQKGLASFHDREMQVVSSDCRNLLHQLIEPNPELRIPMSEIMKHPWLTRNGKYPFISYVAPSRDKGLRTQIVRELSMMMDLKRVAVEEKVKENRADELSAMYNMLMYRDLKEKGLFDKDHTTPRRKDRDSRSRSNDRDKIQTPESSRGKEIRTKSGAVKKVPNKSSAGKAGAGSKGKPKNLRLRTSGTPRDGRGPERITGDRAQVFIDSEMVPDSALSSPKTARPLPTLSLVPNSTASLPKRSRGAAAAGQPQLLALPGAAGEKAKDALTANGPTTRIPPSQRRQPPAKLNLTLDLSMTSSWSSTSKRALAASGSPEVPDVRPSSAGQHLGIEASSGVPPKLSPKEKEGGQKKGKIPVLSPTRRDTVTASTSSGRSMPIIPKSPRRPSTLQYSGSSNQLKARAVSLAMTTTGVVSSCLRHTLNRHSNVSEASTSDAGSHLAPGDLILAPKATPEDSMIDSYSTSSEEEAVSRMHIPREEWTEVIQPVVEWTAKVNTDADPMHAHLLNHPQHNPGSANGAVVNGRLPAAADPHVHQHHESPSTAAAAASGCPHRGRLDHPSAEEEPPLLLDSGVEMNNKPSWESKMLLDAARFHLLRNLGEYDSSGSQLSRGCGSSQSGDSSQIVHFTGSGSSLPAHFQRESVLLRTGSSDLPKVTRCLSPENRSGSLPANALVAGSHRHHNPSLTLTLTSSGNQLVTPRGCHTCGISPSSPTYQQRHSKFCHVGANALDMFFSPDEVPSSSTGMLWRPVASTLQDSPTLASPIYLGSSPTFGPPSPALGRAGDGSAMQRHAAAVEGYVVDGSKLEFLHDLDPEDSQRMPLLRSAPSPAYKCPAASSSPPAAHIPPAKSSRKQLHQGGPLTSSPPTPSPPPRTIAKDSWERPSIAEAVAAAAASASAAYSSPHAKHPAGDALPNAPLPGAPMLARKNPPKSGNKRSDKQHNISKNGVHSTLPDTNMRLEPSSGDLLSASSSTYSLCSLLSDRRESADRSSPSCNAVAKVHPSETSKEEELAKESRIPRPSGRFSKIQVLNLLHHKDRRKTKEAKDEGDSTPDSSAANSPALSERKLEKRNLLKQYDPKSRQYSWRQGLSHLLRRTRSATNSNNNISSSPKKMADPHSNSNSSSSSSNNKSPKITPPPPHATTTQQQQHQHQHQHRSVAMGNSLKKRVGSNSNSNSVGVGVGVGGLQCAAGIPTSSSSPTIRRSSSKEKMERYYREMDARWTAPPSPPHKCNFHMQVSSSPVPSTCSSPATPLLKFHEDAAMTSGSSGSPPLVGPSRRHRVSWARCKDAEEQSSDEGVDTSSLPLDVTPVLDAVAAKPNRDTSVPNSIPTGSHMTSTV